MNGILVMDKPAGFTSFDVVAKLRGILGTRKLGHGGTLDPMATGVLPVFAGTAAKAVDMQPNQDKTYEAVILLGTRTDTGDITGTVLENGRSEIDEPALAAALQAFTGPQRQTPPMYSAVKVAGRPLYDYARAGQEVARKSRDITIYGIERLGESAEDRAAGRFAVRVRCSKGTYIRVLAEDIGASLGTCATLYALRRTAAGVFAQDGAHTFAEVQQAKDAGALEALLLPVEHVFVDLPEVQLPEADMRRLQNGVAVRLPGLAPGQYRAAGPRGFAGVVQAGGDGLLRVEKLFFRGE